MDIHAQQLVRLAELLDVSAGVLRDLLRVRDFDGETGGLDKIAGDLEQMAGKIKNVGLSGLPLPPN